jgi:prevent-host-death family protein
MAAFFAGDREDRAMTTVSSYEAKTHLPRLIRAAERGETVIITRHGKPVAKLAPVENQSTDVAEIIERMKRARARRPRVPLEELLAARHEGHKY